MSTSSEVLTILTTLASYIHILPSSVDVVTLDFITYDYFESCACRYGKG